VVPTLAQRTRTNGAPFMFLADAKSKSPPCLSKERRDKDGAPREIEINVKGKRTNASVSTWAFSTGLMVGCHSVFRDGAIVWRLGLG
jgi:hypothetical protein